MEHIKTNKIQHIQNPSKTDGLPDIRKIFQLVVSNWYLFIISFPICLGILFFQNKYTENIYQGRVTVLLKSEDSQTLTKTDLIQGFGLSPEVKTLDNQMFILRSKKVVKRAIDKLDFGIDIYSNGLFKDLSLYGRSPFIIQMDSLHPQPINTPIYIKPVDNNSVTVRIESDNSSLHIFKTEKNKGGSGPISFEQTVKWGEVINTPFCKFKVLPSTKNYIKKDIQYYFYFRSHNWLTNSFRGKIGVTPNSEGSSIIFISTTGNNTYKITRFLDALSEVYLEQSLERKNDIATRTITFIDKQLLQVADSLSKAQEKLMNFKRVNFFNAPNEINNRFADQYFEIEKETKLRELKENYFSNLKKNLIENPLSDDYLLPAFSQDVSVNSIISGLISDLMSTQNEYKILLTQTSDTNPYMDEIQKKLEISRSNLLVAVDKLLENIQLEKTKLANDLNELHGKMNFLPDLERKYLDIERSFKLNNAIYTFLLQKQSEIQITKASNAPDNEIIDAASISGLISPNRKKNQKQALLLALALPIAIIVLKEYLNNKIRDKNDITNINPDIPIIGFVSQYKGSSPNVILDEPHSGISESFRALRTKLKFMCPANEKQIITITSTNTGEGKTFCALNLSAAFAASGKKTALVGFDLRKPKLTEIFDHKNKAGLSNYLIGVSKLDDITYSSQQENLYIIPSGAIPPNPSELISNKYAEQLFDELKIKYDVIIVDSPPIGIVADSRILMEYSNSHLYVVRANKTIKEHFKHTIQGVINDDISNIAFVYNDIPNSLGSYNYYSDRYYTEAKNK